jgi:hypothetical protein
MARVSARSNLAVPTLCSVCVCVCVCVCVRERDSLQCKMQLPAGNSHISGDTRSVFWYNLLSSSLLCTCQSQHNVTFLRNSAPAVTRTVPHISTVQVTTKTHTHTHTYTHTHYWRCNTVSPIPSSLIHMHCPTDLLSSVHSNKRLYLSSCLPYISTLCYVPTGNILVRTEVSGFISYMCCTQLTHVLYIVHTCAVYTSHTCCI